MRSTLIIAKRDYLAAVRTTAFVVSLLLMPLLSGVAIGVQFILAKAERDTAKIYAVIDRTHVLRPALEEANTRRTANAISDPVTKQRTAVSFTLVFVDPSPDDPDAMQRQRYALSQQHQHGELAGFIEIGADVITAPAANPANNRTTIRYQSEDQVANAFPTWVTRAVNDAVQAQRLAKYGIGAEDLRALQRPVTLERKGTTHLDAVTGKPQDSTEARQIASFALPALLVTLMLLVVLLSSVPSMQGIVEEKQQRIAEVLLGCISPFELMLGKLLGVIAVSLTISVVYVFGMGFVALSFGLAGLVSFKLLFWFAVFIILATMMYGSLFMAVGAAASDLKETQSLQMPVTMLVLVPVLLLGTILREPNGKLAVVGSFFPFSSPMMMTARLSTAADLPFWQPLVAAIGVLATALAAVWAAGRIFRVGLLMQGKGVRFGDLVKWVVRG